MIAGRGRALHATITWTPAPDGVGV